MSDFDSEVTGRVRNVLRNCFVSMWITGLSDIHRSIIIDSDKPLALQALSITSQQFALVVRDRQRRRSRTAAYKATYANSPTSLFGWNMNTGQQSPLYISAAVTVKTRHEEPSYPLPL